MSRVPRSEPARPSVVVALTTITTIGYGDTVPSPPRARFIAALLMIGGWRSIGVVTATTVGRLAGRG